MATRSAGPIASFIIGTVMILAGGGIGFFIGKPILDKAQASADWPTVQGEVIESEVESHRNRKKKTSYEAVVIYRNEVDGSSFEGDEVWAGQYSSSNRSQMQDIVRQYPVGAEVSVYYSPDDPAVAVLQPGAFTSSYMVFGIGLLIFGIGCLLVAAPLIKLLFLTAVVATSSSDSFAGGETSSTDDGFRFNTNNGSDDDDAFGDIPG